MMKFLTSDIRRNITKIFCLTLGLAIGLLLVAKAYIEESYDRFIPGHENVYLITESVITKGEFTEYHQTPGAIAPGMKQYIPQVENATRVTTFAYYLRVRTPDGRLLDTDGVVLGDSCLFDVLRLPVLQGNPKEALTVENHCMIPRSLAEKIGGDVIGISLSSPDINDSYSVVVDGVYEDFPVNSSFRNAIYLSLSSIGQFSYDGRDNWEGNDRYRSYVRMAKGTTLDEVEPYIKRMIDENLSKEAIETFHLNFGLTPLIGEYTSRPGVKTMIWVLGLLAFIILISASLNYLLIVIGQLDKRGKEMAIRKCYGTSNVKIFARIMGESIFFLAVSIGLAVLLVLSLSDQCEMLLGYPASVLLTSPNVWLVEALVCLVLLIITGVVPACMYCYTPVSRVFRRDASKRKIWKLALLSVQFVASGLLFCLLVLVFRQYRMMSHGDMGYDYENIATINAGSLPLNVRSTLAEELARLGGVAGVSSAYQDFTSYAAGNNVWIEGDPRKDNQVNVADMYYANADLFDLMGMEFVQGDTFRENADSTVHQVVVEERFIDVMKKYFGATDDNIVGKTFCITEHSGLDGFREFTICGVIKDIRRGGYSNDDVDDRAGVLFPSNTVCNIIYVRFDNLTPEALKAAQNVVSATAGENLYITPFKNNVEVLLAPVKRFGFSVMTAGIAILLISIIGLIGYTTDEVQRRSKEIAIRKVNGTTVSRILRLFCLDIIKIAVPSLLAGGIGAVIIGREWLSQFTDQVSLSPLSLLLCLTVILLLILAVVVLDSLKVARSNPVKYLRTE